VIFLFKELGLIKAREHLVQKKVICVICKHLNGKNKTKIFDNINILDKHIKASHSRHPSYRSVKLLVKNVKIALDLGMVN